MKHILVTCAVLLGMGMAPIKPSSTALARPEAKAAVRDYDQCERNTETDLGDLSCRWKQIERLEAELDRFATEVKAAVPPAEASSIADKQKAWDKHRKQHNDEIAAIKGRGAIGLRLKQVAKRWTWDMEQFDWVGERAGKGSTPATAVQMVAPPTPAKLDPAVIPSGAAPVPPKSTPAVENAGPSTPAVNALVTLPPPPEATPATQPNAVSPTPNRPDPSKVFPAETAGPKVPTPPKKIVSQLQFFHTYCLRYPGLAIPGFKQTYNPGHTICDSVLKKSVSAELNDYLKRQTAKLSDARAKQALNEQAQWENARANKCDVPSNFGKPAIRGETKDEADAEAERIQRAMVKCWITNTAARFDWIAGLTGSR